MKTSSLSLLLGSCLLLALPSGTAAAAPHLDSCLTGLATLLSDPGLNQCIPMVQVSQLLTDPITPALVNTTATALCSRPVCSQASLTVVQNTITQNCVNSTNKATSDLIYGGASLYPPLREGICTRVSPTNGTFCATVSTESITAYMAQHPSPLGVKIFANSTVLKQYVHSMPKDVLCTACNKAMISPLVNYVAQNKNTLNEEIRKWSDVIKTQVQAKCGADFTNGAAPDTSGLTGQSAAIASAQVPAVLMILGAVFSGVWTL
ncbi:hypothetical protein BGZ72_006498 [Mortierella alpina]|nr:hypothetical protein BGZ72_006498 [Mortierella alpina]